MKRIRLRRKRGEKGAALVEFALLVPVIALLVFGLLDLGRAYNIWVDAKGSSRAAADYVRLYPYQRAEVGYTDYCDGPKNATYRGEQEGDSEFTFSFSADPSFDFFSLFPCASPAVIEGYPGEIENVVTNVTVTAERDFQLWTPMMHQIFGDMTIRSSTTTRVDYSRADAG